MDNALADEVQDRAVMTPNMPKSVPKRLEPLDSERRSCILDTWAACVLLLVFIFPFLNGALAPGCYVLLVPVMGTVHLSSIAFSRKGCEDNHIHQELAEPDHLQHQCPMDVLGHE